MKVKVVDDSNLIKRNVNLYFLSKCQRLLALSEENIIMWIKFFQITVKNDTMDPYRSIKIKSIVYKFYVGIYVHSCI